MSIIGNLFANVSANMTANVSASMQNTLALQASMKNTLSFQKTLNSNFVTNNNHTSVMAQNMFVVAGATEKAQKKTDGLFQQLGKLLPLSKVVKNAWKGTMAAFTAADTQKGQEAKLQALTGNKAAGSELYKYAAQYAKGSALSKDQVVGAISASMPFTRDIKQIEQMVKFAERLNALDPSKGFDSAMGAVTSMMQGDTSSVKKSYGVNVDEKQLKGRRSAGDSEGMIALIDEGLSGAGATEELVGERFALLGAQVSEFKDGFMAAIGEAAVPVMESLAQVVMRLNEDFQAGKYQPVINMLVGGMELIGYGLAFVAENADWLIPIVAGLTFGLVALNIALAANKILTEGIGGSLKVAAAIGVAAGLGTALVGAISDKPKPGPTASTLKDSLDSKLGKATMDVNIANSDPVKVTGEVDIEKENLKYLLDIAGARFFAMYSTATLAPQLTVQNMQVNETADLGLVFDELTHMLGESVAVSAQGVYEG